MYDIVIIGAGVVGAMVARTLSKYNLNICILEKENDVAMGATKANSAIVHAGFDANTGSLKARLNVRGSQMMASICKDLGVPYKNNGSLVIGFNDEDREMIHTLLERGICNGVADLRIVEQAELKNLEPNISEDAICALYAPTGAIVCPYELTIAAIGNAIDNGADLKCNFKVCDINKIQDGYEVYSEDDAVRTHVIINCAGLYSDVIAKLAGDHSFDVHPRKGEYILLDKECGELVSHTIFRTPCPIEHVVIGKGILQSLHEICKEYQSILMVSDQNTYRVCGKEVEDILGDKITTAIMFDTGNAPLIPNEQAIEAINKKLSDGVDLILGVGSGVINDLCKYVSFAHQLPYYIVATAPSMDGYASVGSALILKGMKVTLNAASPKAIIADTRVLKDAPMDMLQAGYGDIIGKYSCLNDWKLSALINDEYFCQKVYDIAYETADKVRNLAKGVAERDEEAVGALMEALVIVGIAMAYVGNSRPASGSEHHFSHYFEITGILTGTPYLAHGLDVVYASVLTAKLREQILSAAPVRHEFDEAHWMREIERIYLNSADEVIALQRKMGWYRQDNSHKVMTKWNVIKAVLEEAPTEEEMLRMVEAVGLNYQEFVDLYGENKIKDGILYAKDLKDRYSVLWLYYEFFR